MKFESYSKTFLHFYSEEVPDFLKKHLPRNKKVRVADLGAGDGALLIGLLASNLIDRDQVVAIDLSEERCKRLSENTGIKAICSDVTNLMEIETESMDFVICTQVIEHVDEKRLLNEIGRILEPNGMIYIASIIKRPYGWWYYKTLEGKWGMDPTHLREYKSKDDFEQILENHGMRVIETKVTPLRLSVLEFLTRRVFVPVFGLKNPNAFFMNNSFLNFLRKTINVRPMGYYIIETVAELNRP